MPTLISSNVGAKDIVRKHKNGFIISDTFNTDYIAAKIALLLDKNIRNPLAEAAYQTANQNTWDNVTKKYVAIYEDILTEHRN